MNNLYYHILTTDFRTSLWQLSSSNLIDIGHIGSILLRNSNISNWYERTSSIKKVFHVNHTERVIFYRDTSFLNDGNQGLVITDCTVYMIEDNDHPENLSYFPWSLVDYAEWDGEEIWFHFTDGDSFSIPIKFFTKLGKKARQNVGNDLAHVFSFIGEQNKIYLQE